MSARAGSVGGTGGPQNLLLVHCHDLGRFLGTYGIGTVRTPHLDAFGAEAVVFDRAFATSPHCSPARASLFTGDHPQRHGVLGLSHAPFGWDLRDPGRHLAAHLHRHGYRTDLLGVHHESRDLPDAEVARRLGFDTVRTGGMRAEVTERAVAALRDAAEHPERPFYLQVGFHEPHRTPSRRDAVGTMGFLAEGVEPDGERGVHVPGHLLPTAGAHEEMAELQGAVHSLDLGVGEVLAELDRTGLAERTVVVFTTDHGLALPRAKCTLYDAGLGVSLMMRAPGRRHWSSRRIADLVSHLDVVPTVCDLLGLPTPPDRDGLSLVPVVEDGTAVRDVVHGLLHQHIYDDPKRSARDERWKLVVNFAQAPRAMDPTQSWVHRSLPVDLVGDSIGQNRVLELYDLWDDPDELRDRSEDPACREHLERLAAEVLTWMQEVEDPLLTAASPAPRLAVALDRLHRAARTAPTTSGAPAPEVLPLP